MTKLDSEIMKSFSLAKLFRDHSKKVTSLQFDPSGEYCITAGEDESIHLYDAVQGVHKNTIHSKKYGVDHVRYLPLHVMHVLHTSTKTDDTIRLLSLADNRYLRYFRGHTSKVVTVEVSPVDDFFISGSLDEAIRVWDIRQPTCVGYVAIRGRPCVAIDPEGLVFAIGIAPKIRLYDVKSYEKGPFAVYTLSEEKEMADDSNWCGLTFSNDGRYLLVSTRSASIYLLDAFHGTMLRVFSGHVNNAQLNLRATFTLDSQFVLCGSQNGDICIWETETGYPLTSLKGHPNCCHVVQFNLGFWIPTLESS
jgi:COMPASS component SWD2